MDATRKRGHSFLISDILCAQQRSSMKSEFIQENGTSEQDIKSEAAKKDCTNDGLKSERDSSSECESLPAKGHEDSSICMPVAHLLLPWDDFEV